MSTISNNSSHRETPDCSTEFTEQVHELSIHEERGLEVLIRQLFPAKARLKKFVVKQKKTGEKVWRGDD